MALLTLGQAYFWIPTEIAVSTKLKNMLPFCIFSLQPAFLRVVHQQTSCLIWAWQLSGLNNWSLQTAAYPTRQGSKHDEGWVSESNCEEFIGARVRFTKGFLPIN